MDDKLLDTDLGNYFLNLTLKAKGLSPWLNGKVSTYIAGDTEDMNPWLGRSPGEGNGNPHQYHA